MLLGRSKQRGTGSEKDIQLLVYAYDVSLWGRNRNIIKKNKGALLDTTEEVGLEVNTDITKYMCMSHHQTAGQNHNIK
jgi:hypothetical protein